MNGTCSNDDDHVITLGDFATLYYTNTYNGHRQTEPLAEFINISQKLT